MDAWRRALILLLAACLVPAWAAEIQGQKPVTFVGDSFRFVPGAWATYHVQDKAAGKAYRLWIATLEKGPASRGPSWLLEMRILSEPDPLVFTRVLVRETPQGPGEPLEVVVQVDGKPPFTVPKKYLRADKREAGTFRPATVVQRKDQDVVRVGDRELTVTSTDAKDADGGAMSVTTSDAVPPLCIVAAETSSLRMDLEEWGTDATSGITGKPMNFYLWLMREVMSASASSPAQQ